MVEHDGFALLRDPRQILYDLIPLPDEASVLNLHPSGVSLLRPGDTRFARVEHVEFLQSGDGAALPAAVQSRRYDLIVLHGTLDSLKGGWAPHQHGQASRVVGQLRDLLSAGGILAVLVHNRFAMIRWAETIMFHLRKASARAERRTSPGWQYGTMRKLLLARGFCSVQTYAVSPGASAPRRMISMERVPAQNYFEKELVRLKEHSGLMKSALYWALIRTGLIRFVEPCYLFWAQK
jgi:hypothetical protein